MISPQPVAVSESTTLPESQSSEYIRLLDLLYPLMYTSKSTEEAASAVLAEFARKSVFAVSNFPDLLELVWLIDGHSFETTKARLDLLKKQKEYEPREPLIKVSELVNRTARQVATDLITRKTRLDDSTLKLQRLLDARHVQLRKMADHAVSNGMKARGKVQINFFRDAMVLIRRATETPVGQLDYAAWFEIGWLVWQTDHNLARAEDAFARCAHLAKEKDKDWLLLATRHQAYIRYLRGRYDLAWEAGQVALEMQPTAEVGMEAALYAAGCGQLRTALDLLEKCISNNPLCFILMFAEPDFQRFLPELEELATRVMLQARGEAASAIDKWKMAHKSVSDRCRDAQVDLSLPSEVSGGWDNWLLGIDEATYLEAVEIALRAVQSTDTLFRHAEQQTEQALAAHVQNHIVVEAEIHKHQRKAEDAGKEAGARQRSEIAAAARQKEDDSKPNLMVCWWIAVAGAVLSFYLTGSASKALALFLPALGASVAASYIVNSSAAGVAYAARVRTANGAHQTALNEIKAWLDKTIPPLVRRQEEFARLKRRCEKSLKSLRLKELD